MQRCHRVSDEAVAAVALKGTLRKLNVNSLPHVGISTVKALATAGRCFMFECQYRSTFTAASTLIKSGPAPALVLCDIRDCQPSLAS